MLRLIFERQWLHALLLAALVAGVFAVSGCECVRAGELLGLGSVVWLWIAVALAVGHQTLVWFCWRTQLHASLLTGTLGSAGFEVYAVAFSILGIARVVAVFLLAAANRETFPASPIVLESLAVVLAVPALYLFYSVGRYFGFRRAFGIDHFDESYRSLPMVRKGIFRYTKNGMYTFGFFILWIPALWCASSAALAAALFNHLYIWVHYYSTELPDIRRIYGVPVDSRE